MRITSSSSGSPPSSSVTGRQPRTWCKTCSCDCTPTQTGSPARARRSRTCASVVNGCRSVQRRRKIARRNKDAGEAAALQANEASAESAVLLAEDRRQVLAALAGLPRRRREVLVLRYYLGLSEAEIASVLGISAGTVKSTAARGLAALARKLGEEQ